MTAWPTRLHALCASNVRWHHSHGCADVTHSYNHLRLLSALLAVASVTAVMCSGHITALGAPMTAFAAAVTTFLGGQTQGNWDALRPGNGDLYTPFKAALDAIWVPTAGDFASSMFTTTANTFNSQSASVEAAGAAVTPALLLAADNYAVAAAGQTLPSVAALTTNLDTLVTAFAPFGTPYSTVSSLHLDVDYT